MTPKTRRVRTDDLPDLMEMIRGLAAFHDDMPGVSLGQLMRDVCGPSAWFTVIVAEGADGGLTGYAALTPMGQLQFGARGMDMHHLFVREGARGSGVGAALVAASIALAKSCNCAFMSVGTNPENEVAGAFYEARGFIRRSGAGLRFSMRLDGSA